MPRKANPDEITLMENNVIEAFTVTTPEEREFIAKAWSLDYAVDLSDFVKRTGLPPVALKVASLIDTESPLLVSPGRGVMYSATACAVVITALRITGIQINTPECQELISRLGLIEKPKMVAKKKVKREKVVP